MLDKTSVAFCQADNPNTVSELMPLNILKTAIFWAMKENLMIQFVYPDCAIPEKYTLLIETIDHVKIMHGLDADVAVFDSVEELSGIAENNKSIVLRIRKDKFFTNVEAIAKVVSRVPHISIIIKDIETMNKADFDRYADCLNSLSEVMAQQYIVGKTPQLNILTDLMHLEYMNNCNAGWESITIGPNGKFYVCPAFYYDNPDNNVGDLNVGVKIPNHQLYELQYAPICRKCDAWQCRRCVWLNCKTTLEVNTPSHEQCVIAHIERNASRHLLKEIRKYGEFFPEKEITEIDYIDPFEKIFKI